MFGVPMLSRLGRDSVEMGELWPGSVDLHHVAVPFWKMLLSLCCFLIAQRLQGRTALVRDRWEFTVWNRSATSFLCSFLSSMKIVFKCTLWNLIWDFYRPSYCNLWYCCSYAYLLSSVFLTIRTAMSCGVRRDDVHARVGCLKKRLCLKFPVRKQQGPAVARIADPKQVQLQHLHPHQENHLLQLIWSVSHRSSHLIT